MNAKSNPLDKLIAEARDRLAKAEREAQDARIEIAALEKAKAVIGQPATAGRHRNDQPRTTRRRNRALSEGWRDVLVAIGRDEAGATLDQIHNYCRDVGLNIERQTLRSQMANYVRRGYLERPQEGVFSLTEAGNEAAGIVSFVRGRGALLGPLDDGEAS